MRRDREPGTPYAFVWQLRGTGTWGWVLRLEGRGAIDGDAGLPTQPAAFAVALAAVERRRCQGPRR